MMNAARSLPQFVRDLLSSPPRHGDGVHNYCFRLARVLHPYRTETEIVETLRALLVDCGRIVPESEILDAVRNSKACAWTPETSTLRTARQPQWPSINVEQREAVLATGLGLVDLWEASPVRFDDTEAHTEEIIDTLFPGNPLLCAGQTNYKFATRARQQWRGHLAKTQLLVPSPMSARTGRTQDGKESEHSLDNTGARRFLVIEQDKGSADEQAAVLLHLAERAPLVLALHSGGKSIHGWFMAAGQPEELLHRFMRYAVTMGADPALWTRAQFVRMPDGTRANGNRQTVYFSTRRP